jgi:hypothetical protein
MPHRRRFSISSGTTVAVGILCICVVMQMLGIAMTMWDLQLQLDTLSAQVLEGLSLPAVVSSLWPSGVISSSVEIAGPPRPFLRDETLLRPPNTIPFR